MFFSSIHDDSIHDNSNDKNSSILFNSESSLPIFNSQLQNTDASDKTSKNASDQEYDYNENYYSSDNDSSTKDCDAEVPDLINGLQNWALSDSVSLSTLGNLLSVLKLYHSELPIDPRTIMKTIPTAVKAKCVPPGEYYHFGLIKAINLFIEKIAAILSPKNL